MNRGKILEAVDRMEKCAARLHMVCASESNVILTAVRTIRSAVMETGQGIQWNVRANPPTKNGRYLCRYVYESNPEYPVYMVLGWNGVDEHPHFNNEMPGVMRVTHWAEIDEPGG